MEKLSHLAAVGVKEQNLFHGTPDEATVRCICHQNFDPRMHGRHGTVYGKGVYFSTTAAYSDGYTKNSGHRFMFFARVLVGKSTRGKPEFQRPPPVDPSRPHGALYDSCVNSTSNPTIFVIFDNDQCYPEFLIEYEVFEKVLIDDVGLWSGNVAPHSSGVYATVPQSSASAAAIFAPRHLSATSHTGVMYPPVVTASAYTGLPVTPVSASATQARPASQTSIQRTTSSTTSYHATPVSAARSQSQARPAPESRNRCVVM